MRCFTKAMALFLKLMTLTLLRQILNIILKMQKKKTIAMLSLTVLSKMTLGRLKQNPCVRVHLQNREED